MLGSLTSTKVRELLFLCLRFISLPAVTIICLLFSVLIPGQAFSATYYAATNGSDNNIGSSASPWATFGKAMTILQPGDTLLIKDGTYNQSLNVTVSGTGGNPITIKAQNDGQAVIDGQNARLPVTITSMSNIVLEGFVAKRSTGHVVQVNGSTNVTLKRVSAYDANSTTNAHTVSIYGSDYVILEDCIASGTGRTLFLVIQSSYVTLRRCYGRWIDHVEDGDGVQIYGSSNCIVENCVFTHAITTKNVFGITIWVSDCTPAGSNNNKIYGNVTTTKTYGFLLSSAKYNYSNNILQHNVSIGANIPLGIMADTNLTVNNFTGVNYDTGAVVSKHPYSPKVSNFSINAVLRNASLFTGRVGISVSDNTYLGSFQHTYNNLNADSQANYWNNSLGIGEKTLSPGYGVAIYGKGAYLMIPSALKGKGENGADIGATVLYRYQDGVLTSTPLWPWPMEDRIFRETGVSVTWEANGGLWKTLDGVYTGTPATPTVDTTPPSAPTAFSATAVSS